MKLNKFKLGVVACFLSVSLSGYAQNEITDAQIQQAEAVPLPAHPGPGQFNNAEDYFVAQAQLAGYSIRSVEIAIDCRKVGGDNYVGRSLTVVVAGGEESKAA